MNDETEVVTTEPIKPKKNTKKRKKLIKRIIIIAVLAIVAAAIVILLIKLFAPKKTEQKAMTEMTYIGSITSQVTGSGVTRASDSAAVASTVNGKITTLLKNVGDTVAKGDKLFTVDPAEADAQIKAAEDALALSNEALSKLNSRLNDIYASRAKLTLYSEFSGKIINVQVKTGDMVSEGQVVATLIDDSKMRLTQYFSYDYADLFTEGMSVKIRLAEGLGELDAKIDDVSMVERITTDGQRLFEVTAVVDNPRTLTEGIEANIVLKTGEKTETDESGAQSTVPVYAEPYETGALAYNRKADVTAGASGTCSGCYMKEYLLVAEGVTLVTLETDAYNEQLKELSNQISEANEQIRTEEAALAEKKKLLDSYTGVSPIAGTVVSCTFVEGQDASGCAITIQNDSVIVLDAQIDEMDVGKVSVGMEVQVSQYDEKFYTGTISEISLIGQGDGGYSYFPAKIIMDNDGTLMAGMYCSFTAVASQIDGCVIAPVQSVKYTEQGTCLFVKADSAPDNAITDLGEGVVPEGFYAIPVEVGISDDYGAQILSGVDADVEVFTSFYVESGDSYSDAMMIG